MVKMAKRRHHEFIFPWLGRAKNPGGGCPPMTLDGPGIHKPLEDDVLEKMAISIASVYVKIAIENGGLMVV